MRFLSIITALLLGCVEANAAGVPLGPYGGNQIDVTTVGMQANAGAFDNSTQLPALLNANGPVAAAAGIGAFFPSVGTNYSLYYFSKALAWTREGWVTCKGGGNGGQQSTYLVFAPGSNGFVGHNSYTSPDGSGAYGAGVEGCAFANLGAGQALDTNGSNILTNANWNNQWMMSPPFNLPQSAWAVGDGIVAIPFYNQGNQTSPTGTFMALPGGTTVTNVSGSTLTVSNNVTDQYGTAVIWQLPWQLAYNLTTTAGSPVVTISGGPGVCLMPGDLISSDAFPTFGSAIWSTTASPTGGCNGTYTITVTDVSFDAGASLNAAVTHAAGSGKMWLIPSALSRKISSTMSQNYLANWPIGMNNMCGAGSTPLVGCTGSFDIHNIFTGNIVGHLNGGADTAASTWISNIFGEDYLADMVDVSSLGSLYLGNNSNCGEHGRCPHGVIGSCNSQNTSLFVGEYDSSVGPAAETVNPDFYCVAPLAGAPGSALDITVPTQGGQANVPTFIAPSQGQPGDVNVIAKGFGQMLGTWAWTYGQHDQGYFHTSINASGTNVLNFSHVPTFATVGYALTDYTNSAAIPGGTTIIAMSGWGGTGTLTLSNNVTGLLATDKLWISTPSPCIKLKGGFDESFNLEMQAECGSGFGDKWVFDGLRYSMDFVNSDTQMASLTGALHHEYIGDGQGYMYFPRGMQIGNANLPIGSGSGRILDFGTVPPAWTGGAGNSQGNIRMNTIAAAGGAAGWYDVANGLNFFPWGLIANDANGYSYVIGTPVAIGSLPSCSGTSGARATVNNGLPSPTYHQAVSAIGSPPTVQPVACAGGTGWIYD